ncbi:putative bifunctional diguanylate cyclase/phosphodiesterase [Salsuginibacillus kocurii]|uniref:putative bifunctional diguanylate cyclase/phosphodiesterase n=1 Tax=Salsuginibacillus kocurii TaxID=427078 RepID=UPI0003717325|nr:EAL domain-containing protein [Salsuginibacillus kocurii]
MMMRKHHFLEFAKDTDNVWRLFNHMNDGLIITDDKRRILLMNPAYEELTGYTMEELYLKNPGFISSRQTPSHVFNEMREGLASKGTWTGELLNQRKNGELFWSYITITYIEKETPEESYYIGIMRDITERKKAEDEASFLAYHDELTQTPNRHLFMEKGTEALQQAREDNHRAAVLFIDLDRFKKVNDSFGHHIGDQLLMEMSTRLRKALGERGMISRFGGDEFTVLIDKIEGDVYEEVQYVITEIFNTCNRPITLVDRHVYITASIGVSIYPEHGQDVETLMKNADSAMYQTKDEGRNNFQIYSDGMADYSPEYVEIESNLRQAIENKEIEPHYQLQIDTLLNQPYGVEALVRWEHPDRGIMSPGSFLPVAEQSGDIIPLDHMMLEAACRQMKEWHNEGFSHLTISVNISKLTFEDVYFEEKVRQVLKDTELPPERLCLEITENMAISNGEVAIWKLNQLKNIGVHVSLDDFGTGFSSLSQLKDFPVDELKIDKSFLSESDNQKINSTIIKLIVQMAESLNFSVICEGIETKEQLAQINKEGCYQAQGYYFSKPLAVQDLRSALDECLA